MKRALKRAILVCGALALALTATTIAEAAIVYDGTTAVQHYWMPTYQPGYSVEAGDEVTLTGTDRYVTAIDIVVFQSYSWSTGTVDAEVRFYKNDGPGGAPGSLLWDSGVIQNIPYIGEYNTFSFDVPKVQVPDTFTWTIVLSNVQTSDPFNFGLAYYGAPTVGNSSDFVWQYNITSQLWVALSDPILANFGGTVYASGGPFQDILAFFDASVANATLIGGGPTNSANNRRGALRNMLTATGGMITQGNTNGACGHLSEVYLRSDGGTTPPDFIEGPAAPQLADMIRNFMTTIGCQ